MRQEYNMIVIDEYVLQEYMWTNYSFVQDSFEERNQQKDAEINQLQGDLQRTQVCTTVFSRYYAHFAGLTTRYQAHSTYECICDP